MITHLNEKLIAVEVPSDAIRYNMFKTARNVLTYFTQKIRWQAIYIPDGTWKILGEVTKDEFSFDTSLFVRNKRLVGRKVFYDYALECGYFEQSDDSFLSLLQSKGIDTNKPNVKHVILDKL